jgi:hypothetical protein
VNHAQYFPAVSTFVALNVYRTMPLAAVTIDADASLTFVVPVAALTIENLIVSPVTSFATSVPLLLTYFSSASNVRTISPTLRSCGLVRVVIVQPPPVLFALRQPPSFWAAPLLYQSA